MQLQKRETQRGWILEADELSDKAEMEMMQICHLPVRALLSFDIYSPRFRLSCARQYKLFLFFFQSVESSCRWQLIAFTLDFWYKSDE